MTELPVSLVAVVAGIFAGAFFFGGLWWTVSKVVAVKRPNLFLLESFALRTAVVLIIIYLSCGDDMVRIGCYMIGFLAARTVIMRKLNHSRANGG